MRKLISVLSVLLGVCLVLSGLTALAAPKIDIDRGISISVKYEYNGAPISGVRFNAYKVADLRSSGEFTPTADFARYSVSFENLNSEKLKSLSDTLSAYINRDKIKPISSSVTSESGFAAFRFEKKQTSGLYLISGEKKQNGNFIYTPETLMISMPALSDDGSGYNYQVVAAPKGEVSEKNDKTQIEVNKVWKNDNGENRPQSVTVQLMRNSKIFAEVTLNKNNNWRYEWTDLDSKYTWSIAEKTVPKNYLVSITRSGKNYIVVNTFDETSTTDPSDTTNPSDPTDPTNPSGTTDPNNPTNPSGTTDPNNPTNPSGTTNPNNPTNPSGTTNPSDPTDPTNPSGTTNPNDPTNPSGTTDPNNPTNPNGTTNPNDPTDPNGTTNPNDPTDPSGTTNPNDPTDPNGTTNPNDPTNPNGTTNPNGGSTNPNGGGTTQPGGTGSPSSPSTTKPSDKIPQTGMLEWPIPLMFEFGAAFIVIGVVFCIRKKNENEE